MTDLQPSPAGHLFAPDEVWDRARDDYLAGLSAPQVCRRYGLGLTALRARAARDGWRRADQPWAAPEPLDPGDEGVMLEARVGGELDAIEWRELAAVAASRMQRAVLRGQAAEALRWRKVRDAMREEQADLDRFIAEDEAWEFQFGVPGPDDPDGPDGPDGVSPAPDGGRG